jgi:hypothetical protein
MEENTVLNVFVVKGDKNELRINLESEEPTATVYYVGDWARPLIQAERKLQKMGYCYINPMIDEICAEL